MYSDTEAAELYNALNPWAPSDDFYLAHAMAASGVLDVGCGTGGLLHRARQDGHAGRLVGIDPDRLSLEIARARTDIEWFERTAAKLHWDGEFELAIMMSHAFQCLVTDEEIRASLAAIHRSLIEGGRFVFETRNPAVRGWEQWHPGNAVDVVDPAGRPLRVAHQVLAVEEDVVTFTETTSDRSGNDLRTDRATLRFLDRETLAQFLAEAGFEIEHQYGGWDGEDLESTSPEIIIVARR